MAFHFIPIDVEVPAVDLPGFSARHHVCSLMGDGSSRVRTPPGATHPDSWHHATPHRLAAHGATRARRRQGYLLILYVRA